IDKTPAAILKDQNIHRQPQEELIRPPKIGPEVRPRKGPTEYTVIGRPRRTAGYISETAAPPMTMGAAPKQPPKKRKTVSISIETERAQQVLIKR
ncbi:hypothetical protein LTR40_014092, partial [Exophiala xenobiotica]